jgi:hypothetical protein
MKLSRTSGTLGPAIAADAGWYVAAPQMSLVPHQPGRAGKPQGQRHHQLSKPGEGNCRSGRTRCLRFPGYRQCDDEFAALILACTVIHERAAMRFNQIARNRQSHTIPQSDAVT